MYQNCLSVTWFCQGDKWFCQGDKWQGVRRTQQLHSHFPFGKTESNALNQLSTEVGWEPVLLMRLPTTLLPASAMAFFCTVFKVLGRARTPSNAPSISVWKKCTLPSCRDPAQSPMPGKSTASRHGQTLQSDADAAASLETSVSCQLNPTPFEMPRPFPPGAGLSPCTTRTGRSGRTWRRGSCGRTGE